jgi:hypothetical protein
MLVEFTVTILTIVERAAIDDWLGPSYRIPKGHPKASMDGQCGCMQGDKKCRRMSTRCGVRSTQLRALPTGRRATDR